MGAHDIGFFGRRLKVRSILRVPVVENNIDAFLRCYFVKPDDGTGRMRLKPVAQWRRDVPLTFTFRLRLRSGLTTCHREVQDLPPELESQLQDYAEAAVLRDAPEVVLARMSVDIGRMFMLHVQRERTKARDLHVQIVTGHLRERLKFEWAPPPAGNDNSYRARAYRPE